MKHVFKDISDVAHLWANKTQQNARRNSGNFYFDGDTIYSYGSHFPIAKHVEINGIPAVLFTERTYSVTTSGHIQVVRQAANHLNIIYCYNPNSSHEDNFNSWLTSAEMQAAKLLKAKKPELYLSGLGRISGRVHKYADYFGLTIPEKLQAILSIGNKSEFAEYQAKKEEFERKENERKVKELKAKHKKDLAKWLKGETHRLYTRNGYDYLRLHDERIETTQAVEIPLPVGKKLWEKINDGTLAVGEKIMHYEVSEVGKEIKIGCHTFKTDYLVKFGKSIF